MADFFREFQVADEKTCRARWQGLPLGDGFFCAFCGHGFQEGDEYRAIYTNDIPGASGNPLCCRACFEASGGSSGLRERWRALWEEYRTRFKWWWVVHQRGV